MFVTLFGLMGLDVIDADLYHSVSTGYAGILASVASYNKDKPLMLTEHGIYTREREEEIIKSDWVDGYFKNMWIDYFLNLSDCAYRSSDRIFTLFEKNKRIQVELGCPREKIRVVHNGVKPQNFAGLDFDRESDKDRVLVGSILRLVPIKDVKTMLQAFSIVNESRSNIDFVIMGPVDEDEDYYNECVEYAEYLNLSNLIFTGKIDIRDYVEKLDIHVLTSISEGQPLSVMETLYCKIPNITTNVGDCESLIYGNGDDLGPAGVVVPVMDYHEIASQIIELTGNFEKRKKMGQAGHDRIKNYYTFDNFINSYKEEYSNIKENYNGRNRV